MRLGKYPLAGDDLPARQVEPYRVAPAGRDRQAVRRVARAAAELDRDRAVLVAARRQVGHRVCAALVALEEALRVVDGDRPEAVDRCVVDGESVDGNAVVTRGRD